MPRILFGPNLLIFFLYFLDFRNSYIILLANYVVLILFVGFVYFVDD